VSIEGTIVCGWFLSFFVPFAVSTYIFSAFFSHISFCVVRLKNVCLLFDLLSRIVGISFPPPGDGR